MKEYVEIPSFFDISKIDSFLLEEFLNGAKIVDGNKISVAELKEYYLKNPCIGLDVIFEMKLRGFTFHVDEGNLFLQFVKLPDNPEIIYTETDTNKIAMMDKKYFEFFDYDKSIRSDFYFNLIPIVCFKNISDKYDYSYIKNEFENYGFKIIKSNELKNMNNNNKKAIEDREKLENSSTLIKYLNTEYVEDMKGFKIRDIFRGPEFTLFNEYCEKNNIESVYDLEEDYLSDFSKLKGVGKKRAHSVSHKIERIYNNINKTISLDTEYISMDTVLLIEELQGVSKERMELYKKIKLSSFVPTNVEIFKNMLNNLKAAGKDSLYDVLSYNLEDIKIEGMSKKDMDCIIKLISERKEEADLYLMNKHRLKFTLYASVYNRVKEMTLEEVVKDLGGPLTSVKDSIKDKKISEYQGKIYKNIENEDKDVSIVLRYIDSQIFKLHLPRILKELRYLKRDKEQYMIVSKRVKEEKSFKEIGKEIGKDERKVKDIFEKTLKNVNKILKENRFRTSLKYTMGDKTGFKLEELEIDLIDECPLIVDLVRSNEVDDLYYYEILDKVYYFSIDENLAAQDEGMKKIGRFGTIEEMYIVFDAANVVEVEKVFEDFKLISNAKGIYFWENYYYYKDLDREEVLEMYLKYINKKPFVLDEKGIENIKSFGKDRLEIDIYGDKDSFKELIDKNSMILELGSNVYGHIHNYGVDNDVFGEIRRILERMLKSEEQVYSEEIYIEIERVYPNALLNVEHLHSIIKLYFYDEYNVSIGDCQTVSKKGKNIPLNTDILYKICKEIGPVVKYTDIMEITKWPKNRIDITIINSSDIIKLGSDRCVLIAEILSDDVKTRLKEIIDEMFYKGYNTSANIYLGEIIFDPILSEFLDKYDIDEPKDISALIKYLYNDIDGDTNFLYKTNQSIRNIEDAIRDEFDGCAYRQDIEELIYSYGYSSGMLNQILNNMLVRGMYVQVDDNLYSTKDSFIVKKEIKEKLFNYVKDFMERNGYIIPLKLVENVREKFENIDFGWNQHTIYSILSEFGYKKLYRHSLDYSSEILILVEEDSYYESMDELVLDILKEDYRDMMYEENIYNYLVEKGFYHESDHYSKGALMNDLKYRDYIIVDGIGNVSLKK